MYITHEHYENSMSWANSYVSVYDTLEEAKNEMSDSIRCHISRCDKADMDRMIDLLSAIESDETQYEAKVWDFVMTYSKRGYYIHDKFEEDEYHFLILDTEKWDRFNDF